MPYAEWKEFDAYELSNPYDYNDLQRWIFAKTVWIRYVAEVIAYNCRVAWCQRFGHDMEYDGYAGPDSGGESAECRRCYWGWSHTYY
jgi:hypothetical protein